jgi:hypothetical protein
LYSPTFMLPPPPPLWLETLLTLTRLLVTLPVGNADTLARRLALRLATPPTSCSGTI